MVSGANRVLFMASKWNGDEPVEVRHCWYESDQDLAASIVAGWAQFEQDLAAYVPTEAPPKLVAEAVTALPAVSVQVTGSIAIKDNFKAFETALRDFIEHRLIREPATDQDFADLDLQIKALKGAEAALDAAEAQMLAQVDTVDAIKRTKDMLHKMTRDNRLMAEKLLATRKEQIKGEIVAGGIAAFRAHIDGLNTRLGKAYMPAVTADFAGAVKGKRTVDSLRDAVDTELARVKIESSAIADKIQVNLEYLREHAKDFAFLFADTGAIVLKAADDLQTLAKSRIADHKAAELAKEEALRQRIQNEERFKAEIEAREKLLAEHAAGLAAQQAAPQIIQEIIQAAPAVEYIAVPAPLLPAANVVPMRASAAPAVKPTTPPSLKLGQIGERLGFNLTGDFLKNLGFEPAARDKNAVLFHEAVFPLICMRLVAHIQGVQIQRAA